MPKTEPNALYRFVYLEIHFPKGLFIGPPNRRSWTAEVTAFGVVVRIEQVCTQLPLGFFQRSQIPAKANNSALPTSKQYGCLVFPNRCHS